MIVVLQKKSWESDSRFENIPKEEFEKRECEVHIEFALELPPFNSDMLPCRASWACPRLQVQPSVLPINRSRDWCIADTARRGKREILLGSVCATFLGRSIFDFIRTENAMFGGKKKPCFCYGKSADPAISVYTTQQTLAVLQPSSVLCVLSVWPCAMCTSENPLQSYFTYWLA